MPLCLPKENAKQQERKDTDATATKSNLTHQCIHFKPVKRPVLFFKAGPVMSKPGFFTSSNTSKIPITYSQQVFFIMFLTLAHYVLTEMATATDQTLTNNYNKLNKKVKTFII